MSRVLRTDLADDDLMEIGDYIRRGSGNVEVAFRFLNKIDAKCRLYAGNPDLGDARPDLGPNIRTFLSAIQRFQPDRVSVIAGIPRTQRFVR